MKNSLPPNIAVLLFACSPEEESRRKQLLKADSLFEDLNLNTLRHIEKSGLDYFHFTEKEQEGLNFGQRFVHAIEKVFEKGYDFIITLGNDTPHLKTPHIIQAALRAGQGEFTIGPSTDGGFYMMGLSRSQFNPEEFRKLPWQTSSVRSALLQLLKAKGQKIHLLPVFMDLDNDSDLRRFVKTYFFIPISIKKYWVRISALIRPGIIRIEKNFYSSFISLYYNKGSPLKLVAAY